jgi:hypothetical protein
VNWVLGRLDPARTVSTVPGVRRRCGVVLRISFPLTSVMPAFATLTAEVMALCPGDRLVHGSLAAPHLRSCRRHPSAAINWDTASIRARWVKAWGKFPRCSPVDVSISSAYSFSGPA